MASSKQSPLPPSTAACCSTSTMSEDSSVLMSNELESAKPGLLVIKGQISQIPGLSPGVDTPEAKARGRRTGVLQGDSDYVKLAKQGGHKGLLWHEETFAASEANSYKPPDWFNAASGDSSRPNLINSEKKNSGAFQPLKPPFGTDSMSAWERDDSSINDKEKNNNVHCSQMEKLQPNQYHQTSKFKRIVLDKKPAPVNMSKLLSFGYAEDDKATTNSDSSN